MNRWNRWRVWSISRIIFIMNHKMSYLVTLLVMFFLFVSYFQQNLFQEYSRYNWRQSGNRELLNLHNRVDFKYQNQNNSTFFSEKINSLYNEIEKNDKEVKRISKTDSKSCKPKYNIVFLKTHKCASTTVQNIFMRNGFNNNKVFVLPAKDNYLGHPMPFSRDLVPDPKHFKHSYNILTHHSRLDYESMRSLMPNNTLFITIVRQPIDLFESMFHYYHLNKLWNISLNVFNEENYIIPEKVLSNRYMGKIGVNQMMFDLGMNISDFTKAYTVREYIKKLDNIFHLVLVAERMDESLVLLKKLLCWTTDDIIAFKLNARKTTLKSELTELATLRIRDLNWADHQLYKHFSHKFSLLVNAFGTERMSREVNELKERTNEWFDYCVDTTNVTQSDNTTKKSIIIRLNNKQMDNTTCWLLTAQELDFTKFLRIRQLKAFPGSVFRVPKSDLKIKMKLIEDKRRQLLKSKLLSQLSPKYRKLFISFNRTETQKP